MNVTGGTFKLEVHDIPANDDHTVTLVTAKGEKDGKKREARTVHVTHPDPQGRVKEFWAFEEDQAGADAFYS